GLVAACVACSRSGPPEARGRAPPAPLAPAAAVATARAAPADPDSVLARGEAVYLRGRFDSARVLWGGALVRARAARDTLGQSRLLTWLGLAAYRQGDYVQARRLGEQALALKLRAHAIHELSHSYNALGLLAWNEGRLGDATGLFGQAAQTARAAGDEA